MPVAIPPLDPAFPIVMLPLRLETRYFSVNADLVELRVRIFPSAAHVTSDRPGVDPVEHDETIGYWQLRRASGDDDPGVKEAWDRLIRQFGEPRMRYLRQLLTPDTGMVFPDVAINQVGEGELNSEAQAMPAAFIVTGYIGTQRVFEQAGNSLQGSVLCGPHGADEALRWQWDFADAEAKGLAVRLTLQRSLAGQLTHIMAIGVTPPDPQRAAAELATLVERWSRAEGAALLEVGTPTNNTGTARVTRPQGAPEAAPGSGTDGFRLAGALGIDPVAFAQVTDSDRRGDANVAVCHQAVWPATLHYFLKDVMSPLFGDAGIARAKDLFVRHVRARGPHPTLLMGTQPFGILPISASARWLGPQGAADPLVRGLAGLMPKWLEAAKKVPTLDPGDAVGSLNRVLAAQPFSTRWLARSVETRDVASRLFVGTLGAHFSAAAEAVQNSATVNELAPAGLTGRPRALDHIFANEPYHLRMPRAAPPGQPADKPLANDYISAMIRPDLDALRQNSVTGASPRSLLYYLLRAATLQVAADAAEGFHGTLTDRVFIGPQSATVFARLKQPVAALQGRSVSDVLGGTTATGAAFGALRAHRAALKSLAAVPAGTLSRMTAEALDACSFRLDAWLTATASERLAAMRLSQGQGAHLGGYAWVQAPPLPAVMPSVVDPVPLDVDSQGYIHAPTLDHARTAAVLRAAFAERRSQGAQAPLNIELSSERVRAAREILAGLVGGRSLAVLLGMRLERWLLDFGLAVDLAALHQSGLVVDGGGRKWLDGAVLAERWAENRPTGALGDVAARLVDLVDACSDLLRAEATHQQLAGRSARAQTAMDALYSGLNIPSEFDVVRSPSTATGTTWRVVIPVAPDQLGSWIEKTLGNIGALAARVALPDGTQASVKMSDIHVAAADLVELAKAGAPGSALAQRLAASNSVDLASVSFSPGLSKALNVAAIVARLLRGTQPLSPEQTGPERAPLAAFARASQCTEWLHDLARIKPVLEEVEALADAGKSIDLHFTAVRPGLNLVSLGPLRADGAGVVLDSWNETTPGLETTTGVAFHFDAPKARPAQAILLMVPPVLGQPWDFDTVEAIMFEFGDLLKARMVRPAEVAGTILPALYFAENLADDVISTDFVSMGVQFEMVTR